MRNFMTTLLLSQGVPMLLAGDELCHNQQGNNNTYCQDNELTWLNWELTEEQQAWYEFVRSLTISDAPNPYFSAVNSFRTGPFMARTSRTSRGLSPQVRR